MPHSDLVLEKAIKVQYKLSSLATATCSLQPEVRKAIYSVLVEQIIFCTVAIWCSNKVDVCKRLLSIQHFLLLCITKCYSEVQTDELNVLSGVVPLDFRIGVKRDFQTLTR